METVELKLEAGTANRGRWTGAWTVHSTHNNTYRTTFVAVNTKGQEEKMTLGWTDPPNDCTPPDSGEWSIEDIDKDGKAVCNQGLPIGPENGRIIISRNTTLQIYADPNADTALVWSPGQEIELQDKAQIKFIDNGPHKAQLAKGYIFVKDQDSDSVVDGLLDPNSSTPAKRVFVSSLDDPNVTTVTVGNSTIYVYTDPATGEKYTKMGDLGQTVNGNTRPKDNDCDTAASDKWRITSAYPDKDGDGFSSYIEEVICIGDDLPANYSSSAEGDCYDSATDKIAVKVFPGQTDFFSVGYGSNDSNFDYNCDGTEEIEITNQSSITCGNIPSPQTYCYTSCDSIKQGNPGWQSSTPPGCGKSAVYIDTCANTGKAGAIDNGAYCLSNEYSCRNSYPTGYNRVQACR